MKRKPYEFIIDSNNCFICISHAKNKDGHCIVSIGNKTTFLHRYIYEQCFGEIPQSLVVRHTCDNPACINPEHLQLGTHQDNVKDRVLRQRSAIGEKNGRSKLTTEQVREIKLDNETTHAELARKYGIDRKVIDRIKNNLAWRHVQVEKYFSS